LRAAYLLARIDEVALRRNKAAQGKTNV
jgi:hypothetical protein